MRKNIFFLISASLLSLFFVSCLSQQKRGTFSIGKESFLLNGKPYVVRSGEMHFMRIPAAYWEHRLKMAKAMGLNTVCAYMFWNAHEEKPDEFNFSGRRGTGNIVEIPAHAGEVRLDIFVEAMGRVNYGGYIHDRKGLVGKVAFIDNDGNTEIVKNWTVFPFPLSSDAAPGG